MRNLKIIACNVIIPVLLGILIARSALVIGDFLWRRGIGSELNGTYLLPLFLSVFLIIHYIRFSILRRKILKSRQEIVEWYIKRQVSLFGDEEIPSKIEMNAILDRIIETNGEDQDALSRALMFCSRIKPNMADWEEKISHKRQGESFRGLTDEMGEVEIREDQGNFQSHTTSSKARVGQYKLWRDIHILFFQNYRNAELNLVVNPLNVLKGYSIIFNPNNFQPLGFGLFDYEEVKALSFFGRRTVLVQINVINGEMKGKKLPFAMMQIQDR